MRLLSFILSVLILFQSMSFTVQQMAQIDDLIEHARLHKTEYGDSFFVFLSKHYGQLKTQHESDQKDKDHDHEQLPFNCQSQILTSVVFFDYKTSECQENEVDVLKIKEQFFYLSPVSDFLKEGLLQPPRSA